MCAHVGIQDVSEIIETQHMVVDGTVVAVIAKEDDRVGQGPGNSSDALSLYFDLGAVPIAGIERKLLEINANATTAGEESFGVDPNTGSVVFRAQIELAPHESGGDLARSVAFFLERGRRHLYHSLSAELPVAAMPRAKLRFATCASAREARYHEHHMENV